MPIIDLQLLKVIILKYVYSLPRAVKKRRGKYKNKLLIFKEQTLAQYYYIISYANNQKLKGLIKLLIIKILRIKPKEQLPIATYLKKGYNLGLFNSYLFNLESTTLIQQTALQGEISNNNSSTTIVLGPIQGTKEILNYNNSS